MKKRYSLFMFLLMLVSSLSAQDFVTQLKDGSYYRISSPTYSLYMTEVDGKQLKSIALDETNLLQCWKMVKKGSGYAIQNAVTERYVQSQTTTSGIYLTGATAYTLYPALVSGTTTWTIANSSGDSWGLHTASSQSYNVVRWYTNADASKWQFQEVELNEEDLEKARAPYEVFNELEKNKSALQTRLNNLFSDYACTTLKEEIQSLTDEELAENANFAGLNDDMKAMVLKVKNNTWQQFTNEATGYTADYERFFRIADYKIYSNYAEMCNRSNFEMSNQFGKLSGPTGIVAQKGDIIYLYVDAAPKSECTLQLECVGTIGVPGDNRTGQTIDLKRGLNVYMASEQKMLYIFHQLNNTKKYLANYPDIKIHIEGGSLHGYWDATRGMTNADWALLQQDLLKEDVCKNVNLKTKHLVFAMDNKLVKECEPKEMEGLMRIWDMIPENEERYMGVEDFVGRYNNIWNVFSINYNYMFATTNGTYYNETTLPTIMNYDNMRKRGNLWGPSHEMGHNHQASINVIGTTESSNNMFSNINTFEQGIVTSRRQIAADVFWELGKQTPWVKRNIWNTTSMFYQLYLYFHVQHHDDQFLPNLFRKMRTSPINKGTATANVTYINNEGNEVTGTVNVANGAKDYLHLAKMICDVAQADLSEFFEAYGMFVPINKVHVGDYTNYLVTTTQSEINAAKKYMQKYPKKLGNIMFIEDHILPMKAADPNNKFEGLPDASGKKINNLDQHNEVGEYKNLPIGDMGDYEQYDGRTEFATDNDYCTISSNTISFKGTGCLGHKFYDADGNLVWATNASKTTMPTGLAKRIQNGEITIVAAEPNMKDVPCPFYKSGSSKVYGIQMYFGNEEQSKKWWAGTATDLSAYMPENTIGVVTSAEPVESITSAANIVNDGTAKQIVLNGDKPAYIPAEITAESVKFTKTIEGVAALDLPFRVTKADIPELKTIQYANGVHTTIDAESVEAGHPVVVTGNIDFTLSNASLRQASYQELKFVKVLAADGESIVEVEQASPFIYSLGEATAIEQIAAETTASQSTEQTIYDLSGRRIAKRPKAGLYIVNGKKQVIR